LPRTFQVLAMTRGVKGDEYKGEGTHVKGEEIASSLAFLAMTRGVEGEEIATHPFQVLAMTGKEGPCNDMRVEGEDSGYPKNSS